MTVIRDMLDERIVGGFVYICWRLIFHRQDLKGFISKFGEVLYV